MKYSKRNSRCNGISSIINGITSFLSKGWELMTVPSNARCDAYSSQASYAQTQMHKDGISRKERKFWVKQNDRAMNGLAEVQNTNSETFIKSICAIGAGLLIGQKIFNKK